MINVKNISFSYAHHKVLDNVSFNVDKNRLCAFLGSNGSGKTTLFNICMNFIRPSSGEIFINNEYSLDKNPFWMSQRVAFVSQQNLDIFGYTALEIVLMARTIKGVMHKKQDFEIAKNALNLVGAYHLKDKSITNLSGGEKQLVFIARAIAQQCCVIMLDEPTSALDFKNQILFWEIIKKISNNTTILVCTHEPNHALWFCDDIVGLKKGKIVALGKTSEVINEKSLELIYDKKCEILEKDGRKFIIPNFKKERLNLPLF